MEYIIIPKDKKIGPFKASSKEEALHDFATIMDTNVSSYFEAVTEEELHTLIQEKNKKIHDQFVTDFMKGELINQFDLSEEDAEDVAENAYELYCEGNGETEYECIEEAYRDFTEW